MRGGDVLVAQIWTFGTVPSCNVMLRAVGGYRDGGGGAGGRIWTFGAVPPYDVMLKAVGGWGWAAGGTDLDFGHSTHL